MLKSFIRKIEKTSKEELKKLKKLVIIKKPKEDKKSG